MKEIYQHMWDLARPYYEKGRPMDLEHIEWMMEAAEKVCEREGLDDSIFIPLVILHDVGYSQVEDPKDNPYKLDIRRAHMAAGATSAVGILNQLNYPEEKVESMRYYVSVHDSLALGNNEEYKLDKLLSTFNDLDFMWMATPKGFPSLMKMTNRNKEEMLNYLETNDKLKERPWSTETTRQMWDDYIRYLKK